MVRAKIGVDYQSVFYVEIKCSMLEKTHFLYFWNKCAILTAQEMFSLIQEQTF